jgi:hypothetical protein
MSMKSSLFSKIMMLAAATLLATGLYAAGAVHKGNLQVGNAVQVNGKELPPGDYTVTWEGEGPNVDLHIARGNKEVATAQAKLVPLDKKASQDAAEVSTGSGSRELSALRFAGQKYELDVVNAGVARSGESLK